MRGCGISRGCWLKPDRSVDRVKERRKVTNKQTNIYPSYVLRTKNLDKKNDRMPTIILFTPLEKTFEACKVCIAVLITNSASDVSTRMNFAMQVECSQKHFHEK
jgi:hypothetical protein